ncbi:Tn3 family transposase [Streptomyces sp. NPDC040750]|uniref:Tn3 family transposase n=1 Tax=Streptomyces sp. NPDC040750 TaxID=3154491 RepID=UPI0033C05594
MTACGAPVCHRGHLAGGRGLAAGSGRAPCRSGVDAERLGPAPNRPQCLLRGSAEDAGIAFGHHLAQWAGPSAAPRRRVTAVTHKVETFNRFSQWNGFGNRGVIADNDRIEQEKAMKALLMTNGVIFHNALDIADRPPTAGGTSSASSPRRTTRNSTSTSSSSATRTCTPRASGV